MEKIQSAIIPKQLRNQYGEKAWYAYRSCLKELTFGLSELKIFLISQNVSEVRRVLHTMLGVANIMYQESLATAIEEVQIKAKKGVLVALNSLEVDNIHIELNRMKNAFQKERPRLSFVLYEDESTVSNSWLDPLQACDFVRSTFHTQEVESLLTAVEDVMPDVLLLHTADRSEALLKTVDIVETRHLGTEVIFLANQEPEKAIEEMMLKLNETKLY